MLLTQLHLVHNGLNAPRVDTFLLDLLKDLHNSLLHLGNVVLLHALNAK